MKLGVFVLFTALCCAAQDVELRGMVREPGAGGIAGVEVGLRPEGSRELQVTKTVFTNGRGEFTALVPPGRYLAVARLDGYVRAEWSSYDLDTARPAAENVLDVVRLASVTGRVVDPDTREPVAGLPVFLLRRTSARGVDEWAAEPELVPNPANPNSTELRDQGGKTDDRGVFTFANHPPGTIGVSLINPATRARLRTEPYTSPDDLKPIDVEPDFVVWPLMGDRGGTTLGSGAILNLGDIPVRKSPHYRAHLRIQQGDCPEGESLRVYLMRRNQPANSDAIPCGSDVLLRGLEPGSYTLYGVSDWQVGRPSLDGAVWATLPFEVTERNLELNITPQRGVLLEGRFVMADPELTVPEIRFAVRHADFVEGVAAPFEEFLEPTSETEFVMAAQPGLHSLLMGPSQKAYIKEVRYNGAPYQPDALNINAGATAQHLDIVLDNKFASLSGTVVDGGRVVPRAVVYVLRPGQILADTFPVPVDAAGRYQTGALPPGEYRLLGRNDNVRPVPADFEKAQVITLKAGANETLHVRLTFASR